MHALPQIIFLLIKDLCMVDVEATGDVVESDWESESKSKWSEAPLKKSKLQELEPEEKEDIGVSSALHEMEDQNLIYYCPF